MDKTRGRTDETQIQREIRRGGRDKGRERGRRQVLVEATRSHPNRNSTAVPKEWRCPGWANRRFSLILATSLETLLDGFKSAARLVITAAAARPSPFFLFS